MAHPEYKTNQIYHYTSTNPEKAANAAFLMCAFQVTMTTIRSLRWDIPQDKHFNLSKV